MGIILSLSHSIATPIPFDLVNAALCALLFVGTIRSTARSIVSRPQKFDLLLGFILFEPYR